MSFLRDPSEFARLLGLVIPILVALLAKSRASDNVKTALNVVLSSLAAVTATLVGSDGRWAWDQFVDAFINALVVSIAVYYGVMKPTGAAPTIQQATGNVGFGEGKP